MNLEDLDKILEEYFNHNAYYPATVDIASDKYYLLLIEAKTRIRHYVYNPEIQSDDYFVYKGVMIKRIPTKEEIRKKYKDIKQREYEQRKELLKDHDEKFFKLRLELQELCESSDGHEYYALPDNGFNAPRFGTGEWPMACKWCDERTWR